MEFSILLTPQIHRFTAPEMLDVYYSRKLKENRTPYTSKVDVWSMGVVVYIKLGKDYPFTSDKAIRTKTLEFKALEFMFVSIETKSFIAKMLTKNAADRSSAGDLLRDDWFDESVVQKAQEAMRIHTVSQQQHQQQQQEQEQLPAPLPEKRQRLN